MVKSAALLFMTWLMFYYLPATFIANFNNLILLCIQSDYQPPCTLYFCQQNSLFVDILLLFQRILSLLRCYFEWKKKFSVRTNGRVKKKYLKKQTQRTKAEAKKCNFILYIIYLFFSISMHLIYDFLLILSFTPIECVIVYESER